MRILILGGTGEAFELASRLVAVGHEVTSSMAGVTSARREPDGVLRVGSFGGAEGLAAWLREHRIDELVDATHPYATTISANAVLASVATGVPLLRLLRAPWRPTAGDDWVDVADVAAAARTLPSGAVVLVTTGHAGLAHFTLRNDCRLVARLIEPPTVPLGAMLFEQDRPPYTLAGERQLFDRHGFTHLVTKNSGGEATRAKLDVARELGVQVVMVARPRDVRGGIAVDSVDAAMDALAGG